MLVSLRIINRRFAASIDIIAIMPKIARINQSSALNAVVSKIFCRKGRYTPHNNAAMPPIHAIFKNLLEKILIFQTLWRKLLQEKT